jgi:hypothetical protein
VRLALTSVDRSSAKAREGIEGIVADVEVELTRIEGPSCYRTTMETNRSRPSTWRAAGSGSGRARTT